MSNIPLSFQNDDWITEYREGNPIWIATLSDGQNVYRDDGRWENEEVSAWKRLQDYCIIKNLFIEKFRFGFRSNMFNLSDNADGYFFRQGIRAYYPTTQYSFWRLGVVKDNKIHTIKWRIPEFIPSETEILDINKNEESIIWKTLLRAYLAQSQI